MSSSLWAVTVMLTLGQNPYGCQTCNAGGYVGGTPIVSGYGVPSGVAMSGGATGGGLYSTGMGLNAYSGSNGDTLLPFDTQEAWMHGYFQEIGAYGGYHYFRPYNYKHVFSQVDLSYRWGQPQGLPYSQQWWHRYHSRAALNPAAAMQMSQAPSAYEIEMARQRAWRDFQAEQERLVQRNSYAPAEYDTAVKAAMEQPVGARAYVVPATPMSILPRSNEAPIIQEFQPEFAPTGPALR
jgi:hypothetical protein